MKEKFEKWALSKKINITPYHDGLNFEEGFHYLYIDTERFFECWKAAITTESIPAQDAKEPCAQCSGVEEIVGRRFCPICGRDLRL